MTVCRFPGCQCPHRAKGWCNGHYKQAQNGREMTPLALKRPVVINSQDPSEALIATASGRSARIDARDATAASMINWNVYRAPNSRTFYASGRSHGITEKLHRLIAREMGLAIEGREVDHIDGDGLNCRRSNLRLATREQNRRNVGLQVNNNSGIKGVAWHAGLKRWHARIGVDGRKHHLGYFDDLELAAFVYAEAAHKYHGEFARIA